MDQSWYFLTSFSFSMSIGVFFGVARRTLTVSSQTKNLSNFLTHSQWKPEYVCYFSQGGPLICFLPNPKLVYWMYILNMYFKLKDVFPHGRSHVPQAPICFYLAAPFEGLWDNVTNPSKIFKTLNNVQLLYLWHSHERNRMGEHTHMATHKRGDRPVCICFNLFCSIWFCFWAIHEPLVEFTLTVIFNV